MANGYFAGWNRVQSTALVVWKACSAEYYGQFNKISRLCFAWLEKIMWQIKLVLIRAFEAWTSCFLLTGPLARANLSTFSHCQTSSMLDYHVYLCCFRFRTDLKSYIPGNSWKPKSSFDRKYKGEPVKKTAWANFTQIKTWKTETLRSLF